MTTVDEAHAENRQLRAIIFDLKEEAKSLRIRLAEANALAEEALRLRAAIAPTEENVKTVAEALAGNWSYAAGDAGRALAALRCIAERAGRP